MSYRINKPRTVIVSSNPTPLPPSQDTQILTNVNGTNTFSYPGYNFKGSDMFPENRASQVSNVISPNTNAKWFGGVLAPNGKIYMVPYSASNVLILDPITNTYNTTTITNLGSEQYKWQGGVVAPNGKIYGIPRNSRSVLIIDPVTNTADTTTISDLSSDTNKWAGGVLAPNGNIYCIPRNATNVLVINPLTNTKSFIDVSGVTTSAKWEGGVLAPNGNIYGVPYNIDKILQINTISNTTSLIDISGLIVNENWNGGALAPNGRIYMTPLQDNRILVLDPSNNGISFISGSGVIQNTFTDTTQRTNTEVQIGTINIPSNFVNGVSINATIIGQTNNIVDGFAEGGLKIRDVNNNDIFSINVGNNRTTNGNFNINLSSNVNILPSQFPLKIIEYISYPAWFMYNNLVTFSANITINYVGSIPSGGYKYVGSTLAPNGKIYCIPHNSTNSLIIDPSSNTLNNTSITGLPGNYAWHGGVLAPNGKIYCVPNDVNYVQEIKTGIPTLPAWMLASSFNKY